MSLIISFILNIFNIFEFFVLSLFSEGMGTPVPYPYFLYFSNIN